ncbi:DUF4917 domain-containing protein [Candidatus Pacearchaeota archaeon]|nr:MAG: DUF4917 domain-containing protein [Candidatus Pacearchaeota archaeon]
MDKYHVVEWKDIAREFNDGLLLGNGASIAVDSSFNYSSLFKQARGLGFLNTDIDKIFEYFDTSDFELVLRALWDAYQVTTFLKIKGAKIKNIYDQIREVLINTISEVHCIYDEAKDNFASMAKFLKHFNTIASLNYDLVVYWTILYANEKEEYDGFRDCFIHGEFQDDFEVLRDSYNSTLVFYPHGNLVLATDSYGNEIKITRANDLYLLDTIVKRWRRRNYSPLFVSEGKSSQKLKAIRRSSYLNTVYDSVLPNLGKTIVIYGWSIGDNDKHILKKILKRKVGRIAISVFGKKDYEDKKDKIKKIRKLKPYLQALDITLFDARTCWTC